MSEVGKLLSIAVAAASPLSWAARRFDGPALKRDIMISGFCTTNFFHDNSLYNNLLHYNLLHYNLKHNNLLYYNLP